MRPPPRAPPVAARRPVTDRRDQDSAIPRVHTGRPIDPDTAGGLGPVEEATRVRNVGGTFTVLDGPFTEAKELIGGWALMEVRDKDEAIEWTKRFLSIAGDGESTIRQVY
jgi:YCII-related domain